MAVVGIDVGGTFTDVVVAGPGGVGSFKIPSTPSDPAEAVTEALARILEPLERVAHGTTVATNALLQRKGARVALVTTEGFRDVLEIGRQSRPRLYEREVHRPEPLVPRELRLEVAERIGPDGTVERAVDDDSVAAAAQALTEADVEAVAVSLLHSYARRDHEDRVAAVLRRMVDASVVCSADVAPEFREFERTSTTVLSAYLGPVVAGYLGRLSSAAPATLDVMSSAGGLLRSEAAAGLAAALVLSGPAGGAQAAAAVAGAAGFTGAIAFDVGGTSTDVCLIRDGAPEWTADHQVEGYPCRLPALAIHTIGAGGGSVGWVDAGGALRVGPRSAGADPGPACYGRGAGEAALTDAHLVLDRLPGALPGLSRPLDRDAAERAVALLAETAGLGPREAALGMLEVAEASVVRALRSVSVERGIDPAGLPLVAFGGAGPLHAAALAERLGAPLAIVPARAGVLSALGLLLAAPRRDAAVTVLGLLEEPGILERAAVRATHDVQARWGERSGDVSLVAECRYVGQSHELAVPVASHRTDPGEVRRAFDGEHRRRNGFDRPDAVVELVVVRARMEGSPVLRLADLPPWPEGPSGPEPTGRRAVDWGADAPAATPVYRRSALGAAARLRGPAIVEDEDTTVAVPPGVDAEIDAAGSILLRWT